MKFTKIICTLGPGTENVEKIRKMVRQGMDIVRLNLSHGTHAYHKKLISHVRRVSSRVPILMDTKGPEIRTGVLDKPLSFQKNDRLILSSVPAKGEKIVFQTYKNLPRDVKKGDTILIDDGHVILNVVGKNKTQVICKVMTRCEVGSQKSIVIPGADIKLPDLTKKDFDDLRFCMKQDVDIIALSLVKNAATVKKVKDMIKKAKKDMWVVAKIEHPDGVKNIDSIIRVSDGLMVARGDLGLSMSLEEVPLIQKMIIDKCNEAGKPVIVATQMLESMVHEQNPTRAETSDVANAILDGTDAVMLSEETAIGSYPLHAIRMLVRIIKITEPKIKPKNVAVSSGKTIPEAIALSVSEMAKGLDVKAILAPTRGGFTPKLIARYRPNVPIFALTKNQKVMRKMALVRGVLQFRTIPRKSLIYDALEEAYKNKMLGLDDLVIVAYNHDTQILKTTNCVEVRVVGEILRPKKYHNSNISKKHLC